VSILRDPSDWDRLDAGESLEPSVEHQTVRPGIGRIGEGAFACPACDLPLVPSGTLSIAAPVECPFCGGVHAARQYVRLDAIDTAHNRVHLRARLPF
jgi:hypothetical protein